MEEEEDPNYQSPSKNLNFNESTKYWKVSREPGNFICKSNYAISNYKNFSKRAATGQGVVVINNARSAQNPSC